MRYFPIFIDLKDRKVVIVGGGEEALRKVRLLLKTEAKILVNAETLHDELAGEPRVEWRRGEFAPAMLDGAALVFSAGEDVNRAVSVAARERGIPVNAVDDATLSTFIVPSIVDRDPVVVAVGTEGSAPVLALGLRARIDAMLPQPLGGLARAANGLRPRVAETVPKGYRRRSFWQQFFFGPAREAFLAGDESGFRSEVESLLADAAEPASGRVSFISTGNGDPELLTLRAQRNLQEADVIVHGRSAGAAVLELARRDAIRISTGGLGFTGISAILVRKAKAGQQVVRLFSGPVPVEEQVAAGAEGIAIEVVPAAESAKPQPRVPSLPVREDFRRPSLRVAS